jgi:hypothetical protein
MAERGCHFGKFVWAGFTRIHSDFGAIRLDFWLKSRKQKSGMQGSDAQNGNDGGVGTEDKHRPRNHEVTSPGSETHGRDARATTFGPACCHFCPDTHVAMTDHRGEDHRMACSGSVC